MTTTETVTVALTLAYLCFQVAIAPGTSKGSRVFVGLAALYWFSVWVTGTMWHLP